MQPETDDNTWLMMVCAMGRVVSVETTLSQTVLLRWGVGLVEHNTVVSSVDHHEAATDSQSPLIWQTVNISRAPASNIILT